MCFVLCCYCFDTGLFSFSMGLKIKDIKCNIVYLFTPLPYNMLMSRSTFQMFSGFWEHLTKVVATILFCNTDILIAFCISFPSWFNSNVLPDSLSSVEHPEKTQSYLKTSKGFFSFFLFFSVNITWLHFLTSLLFTHHVGYVIAVP